MLPVECVISDKISQVFSDCFVCNCFADSWGFFVGQGHQLDVLCESVGDGEDVLFVPAHVAKRPEKIRMNPHVRFSWLWKWSEQCWRWSVICASKLAFRACLEMIGDAGIHARPVEALKNSLLGFVDAVVAGEEVAVSFLKHFTY